MKIKVPGKSNKKQKEESPPWDEGQSLGSTEELADPKYLEKQRSRHRKNGTLDRYCEMLETQISSLALKVINTHQELLDKESPVIIFHPESDTYFFGTPDDADEHCIVYEDPQELVDVIINRRCC